MSLGLQTSSQTFALSANSQLMTNVPDLAKTGGTKSMWSVTFARLRLVPISRMRYGVTRSSRSFVGDVTRTELGPLMPKPDSRMSPGSCSTSISFEWLWPGYCPFFVPAARSLTHQVNTPNSSPARDRLNGTIDDPNLKTYDSNEGHRVGPGGRLDPPLLGSQSRSKSYGGASNLDDQAGSSYTQTVTEMKRLRSTRMDTQLSTNLKKARTSRILDGPEAQSIRPGSAGNDGSKRKTQGFQIVEDRDASGFATTDLTFGNHEALTLDDIPRIVAAEQAKEQRPNASKYARNQLIGSTPHQPKLLSGHQRNFSDGQQLETGADANTQRPKRYFSELSALEYFIVRHVAVLSMEPLLDGYYTLEDLLGLIETKKPTFWGKFGKAFKNDRPKGGKKKGVFGVGLDTLVERDGVESTYGVGPGALRVPGIIDDAISAMRQMDMAVEGVFRKNGNIRGLKDLSDKIDAKEVEVDLSKESPVQVAALLKKFLRELPDPLLTFKLYRLFIISQSKLPPSLITITS